MKLKSKLEYAYKMYHSRKQSRFLAVGYGKQEYVVECWNSETGENIFSAKWDYGTSLNCNHKEEVFATGGLFEGVGIFDFQSGSLIHKMKTESIVEAISFSPDDRYLATGHANGTMQIWDADRKSPRFGQCIKVLDVRLNCRGMKIGGARGLEENITWAVGGKERQGTLLEFFAERGAILDQEQKRKLAKTSRKPPTTPSSQGKETRTSRAKRSGRHK
jgi:hypothetical protein